MSRLSKFFAIFVAFWLYVPCSATAQENILPGDANNSGLVSNIDVLYWALARGNTGSPRNPNSLECVELNFTSPWVSGNFPDGVNYKYADCDGDGEVEFEPDQDLAVIQANFGCFRIEDGFTPDPVNLGNPEEDPVLELNTATTSVMPGAVIDIDVSLGTEELPLQNIFAVAFTIGYDTAIVADGINDVTFVQEDDSWLNQGNPDNAAVFIRNEPDSGRVQITLFRTDADNTTAGGFGKVGTISIAIETIILGAAPDTLVIDVENVLAIDSTLTSSPVGPLPLTLPVMPTATREAARTDSDIQLFPNPADDLVTVQRASGPLPVTTVECVGADGRWKALPLLESGPRSATFSLRGLPAGFYTVRITTDSRQVIRRIIKYR